MFKTMHIQNNMWSLIIASAPLSESGLGTNVIQSARMLVVMSLGSTVSSPPTEGCVTYSIIMKRYHTSNSVGCSHLQVGQTKEDFHGIGTLTLAKLYCTHSFDKHSDGS